MATGREFEPARNQPLPFGGCLNFEDVQPYANTLPSRRHINLLRFIETDNESPVSMVEIDCWPKTQECLFKITSEIELSNISDHREPLWPIDYTASFLDNLSENDDFFANTDITADNSTCTPLFIRLSSERWAQMNVRYPDDEHQGGINFRTVYSHQFELLRQHADTNTEDSDEIRAQDLARFTQLVVIAQRTVHQLANSDRPVHGHILNTPPKDLFMPNREIIRQGPGGFNSLAGYEEVKNNLLDMALVFKYPEMAEQIGLGSSQGVLLYGEPGVGKSALGEALSEELGAKLVRFDSANIIDKWVGSSARNIHSAFDEITEEAKENRLLVVLIDELESIAGHIREGDSERASVIQALRTRLAEASTTLSNVFFVGTTRYIDKINPDILGREGFVKIEVPRPNEKTRVEIISLELSKIYAHAMERQELRPDLPVLTQDNDINVIELGAVSEGLSAGDFGQIITDIKRLHLREYLHQVDTNANGQIKPINQAELLDQILRIRRSREV